MRMHCSKLNPYLFNHHLTDSPSCICPYIKDNEHYLLHCPLYVTVRNKMLQILQTNINVHDLHEILYYMVHLTLTTEQIYIYIYLKLSMNL